MSGTSSTLVSPGVSVTFTNESAYGSAGPGTIPLVILATASNKASPTTSGVIAPYTAPSLAGNLFLATSQRELIQNFGTPTFQSYQGTMIHGDETNEYGLHAAYSYLGLANRCYVLRADIDLNELKPSVSAPAGLPVAGTYWLNLSSTQWGLFLSNGNALPGNAWVSQTVTVCPITQIDANYVPVASYGINGQFVVVPWTSSNFIYEKISGAWWQIGTTSVTGTAVNPTVNPGDTFSINSVLVVIPSPGTLTSVVGAINGANIPNVSAQAISNKLVITNEAGASIVIANVTGASLTALGLTAGATTTPHVVTRNNTANWPAGSAQGDIWVKGNPANKGAAWVVSYYNTSGWLTLTAPFFPFDSTLPDTNTAKDAAVNTAMKVPAAGTVYVAFDPVLGIQQLRRFDGVAFWSPLSYEAETIAPTTSPVAGTLWYNAVPSVDIMYGTGEQWIGYRTKYPLTDIYGPQLSGSAPVTQSTGSPLVQNDLWIDTSDLENYPLIYSWDVPSFRWVLINNADHTSPFGIVFCDARQDSGTIFTGIANSGAYSFNSTSPQDMALSSFVDPDVLLPEDYPAGMLLFNTRYSTGNVKVWNPTYFNAGGYDPNTDFTQSGYQPTSNNTISFPSLVSPGRWVDASGLTDNTAAPYMFRKAQRQLVVKAIRAQIEANQDIRSELVYFNLVTAPGYVEVLADLQTLNIDDKEVAFVLSDTPIRLKPDGTSISNWAGNAANVVSDSDGGLVTNYEYSAIYYPWGLGTDLSGNEVMIPASSIALSVLGYNDSVAYPWFAPAGFTRGLVTNAHSVGYLASDGTYQPVILNQGQRDVLYTNKINPIAYIPNRGLVVWGQKTLSPTTTAMDRINVARLCNYIKYNLDNIVTPYLFEPNDTTTRKAATHTVTTFLASLVGLRGLYDFAVLCDATNNTPDRIDNYELWIDVAIQPTKSVEFILVPVRTQNTSAAPTTL